MWERRSYGRAVASYQQGNTHFSMERGNENHELSIGFFVHKRIISAVKRVEFINDRMSYIILRGRWFHIIVLNVHASTRDKNDGNTHILIDRRRHLSVLDVRSFRAAN
jgi:hypothetical protein